MQVFNEKKLTALTNLMYAMSGKLAIVKGKLTLIFRLIGSLGIKALQHQPDVFIKLVPVSAQKKGKILVAVSA